MEKTYISYVFTSPHSDRIHQSNPIAESTECVDSRSLPTGDQYSHIHPPAGCIDKKMDLKLQSNKKQKGTEMLLENYKVLHMNETNKRQFYNYHKSLDCIKLIN